MLLAIMMFPRLTLVKLVHPKGVSNDLRLVPWFTIEKELHTGAKKAVKCSALPPRTIATASLTKGVESKGASRDSQILFQVA